MNGRSTNSVLPILVLPKRIISRPHPSSSMGIESSTSASNELARSLGHLPFFTNQVWLSCARVVPLYLDADIDTVRAWGWQLLAHQLCATKYTAQDLLFLFLHCSKQTWQTKYTAHPSGRQLIFDASASSKTPSCCAWAVYNYMENSFVVSAAALQFNPEALRSQPSAGIPR